MCKIIKGSFQLKIYDYQAENYFQKPQIYFKKCSYIFTWKYLPTLRRRIVVYETKDKNVSTREVRARF